MHARREGFIVKIRSAASGAPIGLGFVVGDRHIVTCAHVVNAALGHDKHHRERPHDDARIQVEFVLLGDVDGAPLRVCRVVAWDPPAGPSGSGRDVAGLVVVGADTLPVGAGPARLVDARIGLTPDAQVSVFGYPSTPDRKDKGAWTSCSIRGAVGGGLIQLDARAEAALRAQPGYSGAPVVATDRWGDVAVGMLAIASKGGAAQDAYAVPLSEVAAAWPEALGRLVLPPCPYRGLQAFTAADAQAGVFVGREREVKRLREMVRAQPLVVVTGPSGVGKSSLVAAGLQPALAADGWAAAPFRPGVTPYESVARALLDLEHPGVSHSLEQLDHRARALREDGFWPVASRVALLTGKRLALIGDQFEEVLSGSPDREKALEFLHHLLPPPDRVQDANVRLVCTLRADFLPDLLELPDIGSRLQDRQLNVSPLDEAALTRVIVEPAQLAGVAFSPGLAEKIAGEASRAAGSLPLLEFTLTELWPLQRERQISFDSYHGLGGVAGALNQHAEKAYYWLHDQLRLDEQRIRRALLSMIRARGGASSAVRVTADRSHLGSDWYIAQLLAEPDRRLVILGSDGPETAEIAHEALIREWDRLSAWVEEDADFQQWLTVMEERARDEDLLSATRVAEAQRWLGERRPDIPRKVANLIHLSSEAILEQQQTQQLLSQSQQLAAQLRHQTMELEDRQSALQESNAQLEQRAELLAQRNRDVEVKNGEIEEARQVLEEQFGQLALSTRYKTEFLANMSHELRTPLNSLLILAKLLADNDERNLSPKQVEFAETIHGAGSDLLQLINDILDLSKVEAGKMDVSASPATLVPLADYLGALFSPLAVEKGLNFAVRVSPELPPTLLTDEHRVLQVLRNLLSNAIKFTESGEVELAIHPAGMEVPSAIRLQLLEAGALSSPDADIIAFAVTDTGIGIEASQREVIFEAFRQVERSTSRKYGGTGLGLSISREIAQLLGGEIHVRSEPGHGSTFTLYLPLHPSEPTQDDERVAKAQDELAALVRRRHGAASLPQHQNAVHGLPDAQAPSGPSRALAESARDIRFDGEKVLIVDDDVRSIFALTSDLERHGLYVYYAENGDDAVTFLEQHGDIEVIVIDVMLPAADGPKTIAQIRRTPKVSGMPIIALAPGGALGSQELAAEAGASDCVSKPVDPDVLLPLLRRWMDESADAREVPDEARGSRGEMPMEDSTKQPPQPLHP
ncbi:ATP-binding protein [Streptomyces sp. NPDC005784]|uniref:nSTAND1 domain-containing NTPase n=1 Tax=Streptomyces sp. NPDC005784 TaxID=3364731 RepID=UPI0036840454